MPKSKEPDIMRPLPRRYVMKETLLILFPELIDKLDSLPSEIRDGEVVYDSIAALDMVDAHRPHEDTSEFDAPFDHK